MNDKQLIKLSKFLSLVLRHQPEKIGVQLDNNGWIRIDELLDAAQHNDVRITRDLLQQVVEQNDKKRFAISDDGTMIRASQGHSIDVDLALPPIEPPEYLYHGTATRFLDSIRREGLRPGSRQHVHLSSDEQTAHTVGTRHGKPAILRIQTGAMHSNGYHFYRSANGVWLTDSVPIDYIEFQ